MFNMAELNDGEEYELLVDGKIVKARYLNTLKTISTLNNDLVECHHFVSNPNTNYARLISKYDDVFHEEQILISRIKKMKLLN